MLVLGIQGEPNAPRGDPRDVAAELRPAGWYHDAAAALIEDGRIVAAIEEERLSRRKHTGRFPTGAIQFCLNQLGVRLENVDRIAFGERGGNGPYLDPAISRERIAAILCSELHCEADIVDRIALVEHHVGHAVSAYACSGYRDALIVTADGFGDGIAGSIMSARNGSLAVLDCIHVENSLGRFYGAPLHFFGFNEFSEYKVMGLAPYGDPSRFRGLLQATYDLLPDGRFALKAASREAMADLFNRLGRPREVDGPFEAVHKDLAAALQETLETIMRHVFSYFREQTGQRYLCFAGGTAQNCSLNGKILAEGIFDDIFVQPAANDAGLAIGAALYAIASVNSSEIHLESSPLEHVYLGSDIEAQGDVADTIGKWAEFVESSTVQDICLETARLLAAGLVVGWVQGRSEFGPRALGNRSILADPRPAANKERINKMIKQRESFRPFAPAVLEERAAEYFDLPGPRGKAFPFMSFVVPVRADMRSLLGAVTHVDGTARVQTVSRRTNERFWRLIRDFGELTGIPVLLNTSFNNNAEPIVESSEDALACFLTTDLDRLVIGDFVVRKKETGPALILRCLDLVPTLPVDAVLMQGRERRNTASHGPQGVALIYSIRTVRRSTQISPKAFEAVLLGSSGRPARYVLGEGATATERADLASELRQLWADRLVMMRPVQS
jgi:carbamoyltransferase